ncbi:hypothetical protein RC1_2307 [Rhodospirillum centenum SW]|uniref:Uncharacterized protein n=1 Tax=Rhodospirillum centenum (strain ATCC 51521 / SW) TaxID=414684 RepID=B6IPJ2_RHOCS|nr:hypothetical protein RC1_2307 [Rhodospirillum centenum SW]
MSLRTGRASLVSGPRLVAVEVRDIVDGRTRPPPAGPAGPACLRGAMPGKPGLAGTVLQGRGGRLDKRPGPKLVTAASFRT